jgi:histone-lysine N-methyltransferase SETMAR
MPGLLQFLETIEASKFRNILIGIESWLTLEYQHSAKWTVFREDVPSRLRQDIGTKKFMLTVIWGVDGFHIVDLMIPHRSFNSEHFVNHVMTPMIIKPFPQVRTPPPRRLHLHLDNYRVHLSKTTQQFTSENHTLHVPHPPYSRDLAPSDFWLFGRVKAALVGQRFEEPEELPEADAESLNEIQRLELKLAFSHWLERVRWVLANNGDWYHD